MSWKVTNIIDNSCSRINQLESPGGQDTEDVKQALLQALLTMEVMQRDPF